MFLRTLLAAAIILTGCSKKQEIQKDALQAIEEHTTKMRKILLENRENCNRAIELYGEYVDKHLEALKDLKAKVKKMLDDDKEGNLADWAQEMSAKANRDLAIFYHSCNGRTYGTKINKIDRRF